MQIKKKSQSKHEVSEREAVLLMVTVKLELCTKVIGNAYMCLQSSKVQIKTFKGSAYKIQTNKRELRGGAVNRSVEQISYAQKFTCA